jgi:maltose/maltodextrin transport system permease protein
MSTMPSALPALAARAPASGSPAARWAGRFVGLGAAIVGLWLVFAIYAAGQPMLALGALALFAVALWIYQSNASVAWRYLFPGVVGMVLFIAFPMLYTAQIGFTNYSSSHLLSEERSRAYLLDQAEYDEDRALTFTLHPDGKGYRIRLTAPAAASGAAAPEAFVSPVITQGRDDRAWQTTVASPAATDAALAPAMPMRDVLKRRDELRQLRIDLPGGAVMQYAGVHEFGPRLDLWQAESDGSLTRVADHKNFAPNRDTGWFEARDGEHVQPGFKVGVGLANYARMVGDAEFRGPFLSIFLWTVAFAALTVIFSLGIGMTLAGLLNWESLRFRTLYRTLLFLPYAVPAFISILVFKGLFNQNFGEINGILDAVFGVKPAWFADPALAKIMLLMVNTWLGYPYFLVLCTGLLKAIPADLYEASAIAGASPLTNFVKITAPLVIRPLTPLMISAFAYNFNNFVLIALLTDGRPDFLNTKIPAGTTDILVSYTYRIAFRDSGQNFGLAAAISTVIFVLVALMSFAHLRFTASGRDRK